MKRLLLIITVAFIVTGCQTTGITKYPGWSIPNNARPNYETLSFYLARYLNDPKGYNKWEAKGSDTPYEFESQLRKDKYISEQMRETALLSYLLFEDGKIVIDEITSADRFGKLVTDETKLYSMSVGKSMVSYVLGHAISAGYIDGVEQRIDDWPLLKNTLYEGQKIIDIINMRAGDQQYINDKDGVFRSKDKRARIPFNPNTSTVKYIMSYDLKGTKKSFSTYNYNGFLPNLILNYIAYKSDGNFQTLLDDIFQKKVRIKDSVLFMKNRYAHGIDGWGGDGWGSDRWPVEAQDEDGPANHIFYATRYDYLRIAKAILDDWRNDTCFGKYLKTIYEKRERKDWGFIPHVGFEDCSWYRAKGYGGFFNTDYIGMASRHILGMEGYGGQNIMIDFDESRIVSTHSIHRNYNCGRIGAGVIMSGGIISF